MNHIELFAGCGGLCLGLTDAGFDLLLANELSPMASETFAYNILGEDLNLSKTPRKTLWLSSSYSRDAMSSRLREDPRTYPEDFRQCEIDDAGKSLKGSLVVGNIHHLNKWLEQHPQAVEYLRECGGKGGVDLVSGGPPCQSFSLAGLREYENEKNSLPWAFAKFAGMVRPKVVLLENVTGILRPFTVDGKKAYAWFEVCRAFAELDYVTLPLHVNAKFAGVAQNRPRFVMIGVRRDVLEQLLPALNYREAGLFVMPMRFQELVKVGKETDLEDLPVLDLNRGSDKDLEAFSDTFLESLYVRRDHFVSVEEAIGDLAQVEPLPPSSYVRNLNALFKGKTAFAPQELTNDRKILSQPRVQRRFRIYQNVSELETACRREVWEFLSGKREVITDYLWSRMKRFSYLVGEELQPRMFFDKSEFEAYLQAHSTKKQTQKALIAREPAPAALTIPDDACHYKDLRTLSAREMARIQSFPDNFVFRSKETTGGSSRKFEVPVYTQIGNAVPVLLGRALGQAVASLLRRLNQ